jgi:hypothetical protein
MNASRAGVFETLKAAAPRREDSLARITMLANLMDNAFVIPGLNRRVGLDAAIGLVPFVGDAVSAAISAYIIWEARQLGLPRWKIARMVGNVALDTTVGAVPFVGDLFDMVYKSNMRNLRIVQDHVNRDSKGRRMPPREIDGTATVVR